MKFLKTHYGRSINVTPSDTVNIPNPAGKGITGITTNDSTNLLIDSTKTFTTNLLGAIVVNDSTGNVANVVGFVNENELRLDANIMGDGDSYSVYNSTNNEGCSLYIPAQAPDNVTVLTVGGDVITFSGCGDLNSHTILPVNILRVFNGNTSLVNLIALW